MDFLARHYEKLVLVVCLLCLLWGVSIVGNRKQAALVATSETSQKLKTIVKGKKMLDPLDESSLQSLDSMLLLKDSELTITGNSAKNSDLMSASKFIICKNSNCGNAIPYNTDKCPYCETPQDKIAPDDTWDDDLDGDGIPNIIEKHDAVVYSELGQSSLDYRYTNDGAEDFDGDGFTNAEEFRYAFDQLDEPEIIDLGALRDPSQTPPLAYILRKEGKPNKRTIPFIVNRIKDGDGDPDKSTWKAEIYVNNRRVKDLRLREKNNDNMFGKYKLVDFLQDKTGVIIEDENGKQVTMGLKTPCQEKEYQIKLTFNPARLGKRALNAKKYVWSEADMKLLPDNDKVKNRLNPNGGAKRGKMAGAQSMTLADAPTDMDTASMLGSSSSSSNNNTEKYTKVFNIRANAEFALYCKFNANSTNEGVSEEDTEEAVEFYRLLPIDDENSVIRVQQITEFGGDAIGKPIVINPPNEKVDFPANRENSGSSMMDGGMMMRPQRIP